MSPEARRAQLLDLGVELLVGEPLENLTVLRLAELAGVSRALVFHYFPTVRELHLACLDAAAEELIKTIVAAISTSDDEGDPVRLGLEAFVGYINQQPTTFLAMASYSTTDAEFGGVFESVRTQLIDVILELTGLEADDFCRLLLRGWVAFVEAAIVEGLAKPSLDLEQLLDVMVELFGDVITRWQQASGIR